MKLTVLSSHKCLFNNNYKRMDPNGEEERVYKYQNGKIKTPEELGFLEYYMLPNGDEFEYVYRPGDDSFFMLSVLKE